MLRAGTLYYALAAALLIALLCGALILFASVNRTQLQMSYRMGQVARNAESGMQVLLAADNPAAYNTSNIIDLFGRGTDSVRLTRKTWGLYDIGISEAFSGNETAVSMQLIGRQPDTTDHTALYLADLSRPLKLCGQTELRGTCYLPESGAERSYIEGQNYNGTQLVYGETRRSERFPPKLQQDMLEQLQQLQQNGFSSEADSIVAAETLQDGDSVQQSFRKKVLCYFSRNSIQLKNVQLSGHIAIVSENTITVGASCRLENVLLLAPKIIFRKETSVSVQAIARDSIILEEGVTLALPGALALLPAKNSPDRAAIVIGEKCSITGSIVAWRTTDDFRKLAVIKIGKESIVHGMVYSNGNAELRGELYGSLYCTKLELKTPSSEYENQLLNAVIDRTKCSSDICLTALLPATGRRMKAMQLF